MQFIIGWDKDSWGYHGDDGHSFEESGTGKTYGPRFSTGDVIGCCINMADKTAFYTKNGTYLGIAFRKLKISMNLFPCVGLRTPGEHVTVNFGQEPFVYDIVNYVKVIVFISLSCLFFSYCSSTNSHVYNI